MRDKYTALDYALSTYNILGRASSEALKDIVFSTYYNYKLREDDIYEWIHIFSEEDRAVIRKAYRRKSTKTELRLRDIKLAVIRHKPVTNIKKLAKELGIGDKTLRKVLNDPINFIKVGKEYMCRYI